jgi:hypothetical protein
LQGLEFSRHLTRPIPLETMMMLGISGFDFPDVWELFTERLAPDAATPPRPLVEAPFPDELDTHRFAALMMQVGHVTDFDYRDPFKARATPARPGPDCEERREENARVLAGIILLRFAAAHEPDVVQRFRDRYLANDQTVLVYRSLLGILYDLSAAVPAAAEAGGVPAPSACRFLRVHRGHPPGDAYCTTKYRGAWYWIDDEDLRSKTTLSLLTILYNAIADTGEGGRPQFTIPLR